MKLFVPTTARRTHTLELMGDRAVYVCHTREQEEQIRQHHRGVETVVSGLPMIKDPSMIRDWIEANLVEEGEYYASMDDDIRGLKVYLDHTRASGRIITDPELIGGILGDLRNVMRHTGVLYGGFAMIDNPYFMRSAFKYRTLVSSNVFVTRKDSAVKWKLDPAITCGSDLARSLASIVLTGSAMADGRHYVVTRLGEDSDLGPCSERPYQKITERLCELFPGIAVIENGLLKLRPSQKKIDAWWEKFEFVDGEVKEKVG